MVDAEVFSEESPQKADKRNKGENARTGLLGANPRQKRQEKRESLQSGFYAALSGKRRIRTFHHLGSCFAVPGIDYFVFELQGSDFPSRAQFHRTCQLCTKKNIHQREDVSDSANSASSSSFDEQ